MSRITFDEGQIVKHRIDHQDYSRDPDVKGSMTQPHYAVRLFIDKRRIIRDFEPELIVCLFVTLWVPAERPLQYIHEFRRERMLFIYKPCAVLKLIARPAWTNNGKPVIPYAYRCH